MVALPFAPRGVRITTSGTIQGQPWVNVFHGQWSASGATANDMQTLINSFRTAYNSNMVTCLPTASQVNLFTALDISSATGAVATNNTSVVGTRTVSGVMPASAAVVVSWNISLHYRGGHPRNYLPLGSAADMTSGHLILGTFATIVSADAAALLTAVNAITSGTLTFTMGMFQYHSHHQVVNPPVFFPYTGVRVHGRVDTIRRRLGKETGL